MLILAILLVIELFQANWSTENQSNNPLKTELSAQQNLNQTLYPVVKVVDGDTIDVLVAGVSKKVRLIGINTPESVSQSVPVQCFGPEASAAVKQKLIGVSVLLEADPTQGDLDKYDRLLRFVFLPDGTNFNEWMIANGFAYEYTYNQPYKYQTEFRAAQKMAKDKLVGLWALEACGGELVPLT